MVFWAIALDDCENGSGGGNRTDDGSKRDGGSLLPYEQVIGRFRPEHEPSLVPSITEALLMVSRTDLVGLMPYGPGRLTPWVPGVVVLEAPVKLLPLPLSQAWHRRFDNDGAHQWLRDCVAECL